MANPLYSMLNNNVPNNNMMQMIQQFKQFQNTFKGDPKAQVQQMLNSGKITQAQYNQAVQMANQLQSLLK